MDCKDLPKLDLTKEFFITCTDGDFHVAHVNLPNNTIGDQAFEWDNDGSQRAAWEARMEELKKNGIYGDLEYMQIKMKHNPIFDNPQTFAGAGPFESYSLMFIP